MPKQLRRALFLTLLFSLLGVTVLAQIPRGSIRGTVREDTDGDGKCASANAVAGIPLQFTSQLAAATTFRLQSGSNGTYGAVAVGLGPWKVTAMPPTDYVVTSAKTVNVELKENQLLALNVDFCVRRAKPGQGQTILPQSGGAGLMAWLPASLWLTALGGMGLMIAGAGLEWRRRRR